MRTPGFVAHRATPALILLALALAGTPSALRGQGAPFVPVGSRLDRLASWLMADGILPALDPLVRPFRLDRLRRAGLAVDSAALPVGQHRVFAEFLTAIDEAWRPTHLVAEAAVEAYSNARRDSFRPAGKGGVAPAGGIWASLRDGLFVAVVNPAFELRLRDDPEYTGYTKAALRIAGRMQVAYLAVTGDRGELVLGRMARNWGPDPFEGLQVSPSAYATDALAGAVRLSPFELTAIAARLDDRPASAPDLNFNRYFFAHRLTLNAGRGVWLGFTESGIYGGPGQGFDPAMHAPLNLALLSEFNERRDVNTMLGADAVIPLGPGIRSAVSVNIDDIQIDRKDTTLANRRPTSFSVSLVVSAGMRSLPVHLALGYTAVSYLSYRNSFEPDLDYSYDHVGLARNFSDYDQVLARFEIRPRARWYVALDLTRIRQGSGDFREPFPSDSALTMPGHTLLVAPVRSALGARLTWNVEPSEGVEFRGELGAVERLGGRAIGIAALAARLRFDALQRRLGGAFLGVEPGANRGWP